MNKWQANILTSADVAERLGRSVRRVQQATNTLIDKGLAVRLTREIAYHPGAVVFMRGFFKKNKKTLKNS